MNIRDLKKFIASRSHGGFKSLLSRALTLGIQIDVIPVSNSSIIKLSYKEKILFCRNNNIPLYRKMGNFTKNKLVTKTILDAVGIRTPRGILVENATEAEHLVKKTGLKFPLITKPLDGTLAKGVSWNIQNEEDLRKGVEHAYKIGGLSGPGKILVEEMFQGNEYRVLIFNGKVLSCVQKIAAGVIGDGQSTIKKLIKKFNTTRVHGFEIKFDKVAQKTLRRKGLSLESVPAKGDYIPFRNNLNMSDGGRSVEVTEIMHPSFKHLCEEAMQVVGLSYGGIDFMAQDITKKNSPYIIIEINPNPFYNMHEKPLVEGKGIDVSQIILKHLFPKLPTKS